MGSSSHVVPDFISQVNKAVELSCTKGGDKCGVDGGWGSSDNGCFKNRKSDSSLVEMERRVTAAVVLINALWQRGMHHFIVMKTIFVALMVVAQSARMCGRFVLESSFEQNPP